LEKCCPSNGYSCGIRYPPVNGSNAPGSGQAVSLSRKNQKNIDFNQILFKAFGAYPWQAVVLSVTSQEFLGSGALIDHMHVVTVAHKVSAYT
jgi:hypothetical protein